MVQEIKALIEKTLPLIVAVAAAPKYWSSKRKIRRLGGRKGMKFRSK